MRHHSVSQKLVQVAARAWTFAGYGLQVLVPRLPKWHSGAIVRPLLDEKIDTLRVRVLSALPEDRAFVDDFAQLIAEIPDANAFQTLHWMKPLLDYSQRLNRLRLIVAYDRGRLIGVLPLEQMWGGVFTMPGDMMSDYLDPPIHPDYVDQFWPIVLRALKKVRRNAHVSLELRNLSHTCSARRSLDACANCEGFDMLDHAFDISARIDLADAWQHQFTKLNSHDRKEIKRKLKRAIEQTGAKLEVVELPEKIDAAIAESLHLMSINGGGKARKAKWLYPIHFEQCATAMAREGRIRVYHLLMNDQLAASLIAMPQKTSEILWCGAFDPAFKQFSPGITLFALVMQNAIERKLTHIDLLRGQHDYKYRLGAVDHPLHRIVLTH